jgi:hypothetical protein
MTPMLPSSSLFNFLIYPSQSAVNTSYSLSTNPQPPNPTMADPSKLTGDPNSHNTSEFSSSLSATCLCKSIRVTITDDELFTRPRGHLCHCANCRKVAGSFVSSNLAIEKEKVKVEDEKGVMKKYVDRETGSGKVVERCFCGECGKYVLFFLLGCGVLEEGGRVSGLCSFEAASWHYLQRSSLSLRLV